MKTRLLFSLGLAVLLFIIWQTHPPQPHATTSISLSASESLELNNDEAVILFRVEARGQDITTLRQQVNAQTANISALFQDSKHGFLSTTGRSTNPLYEYNNGKQTRVGWIVVQSAKIVSHDLDNLSALIESIEHEGALLQSLYFRVSDLLRTHTEADLRLNAVASFRHKAAILSKALDTDHYQIKHLQTTGDSPNQHYSGNERMLMKAQISAPTLDGGKSEITVEIQGEIEIETLVYPAL